MDSPEHERKRMARVKELEEIVKKLEQENQRLLTRVTTNAGESARTQQANLSSVAEGEIRKKEVARHNSLGDLESDVVNLRDLEEGEVDDEAEW